MTTLTETAHAGEFICGSGGERAREQITVGSGANLVAGTVLGRTITAATVASAVKASGANTGNGTCTVDVTAPAQPRAKIGVYTVRCIAAATNNGTFRLEDPDGIVLGDFVMSGGALTISEQIKFALADGSTDFAVGDGFDITVSAITYQYKQLAPAATDGTQIAAGILYSGADAASAAKRSVAVVRDEQVNGNFLTWPSGISAANKAIATRQLAEQGIIIR
jgi:hypothetical protein